MRYGSKVLFEEVTVTFVAGRRYGLTGPNGSGKSTFMKILTGELDAQKGNVVRPRKMGVLRQDQFAFDNYRVIDTVIMGNAPLWAALEERDRIYEKPEMTDEDGMRLGELEGIIGDEDGYTAESDAAVLLQGLDIRRRRPRAQDGRAPGRPESARAAGAGAVRQARGADARRADQLPRSRIDPLAAGFSQQLRRHADHHLARPALPELRHHPHRRHRLPDDHHLHRRVRRHGDGQDADPLHAGGAERAARKEDRAAERIHRAVRGRHAVEPGDQPPQGSGTPADQRAGAVQHSAPLHQVRPGAAERQARSGIQAPDQDCTAI